MDAKDRLLRIEEKLDSITEKLHETNVILAENTQSLILHEKRTDLAEKKMELLESKMEKQSDKEAVAIKEIQEHVNLVNVIFKYVIPAIAAISLFLSKLGVIKF